jgi:membrane protein implicated in regulation of membrane protease activity
VRLRAQRASRSAYLRYAAFQVPELGMAAALSWAASAWFGVPVWASLGALALWVAKEIALAPFLAHAYEGHARGGPHDLVGRLGIVEEELAPRGSVRIGPERWRAEAREGDRIAAGAAVRVIGVEGLTARVERAPASERPR